MMVVSAPEAEGDAGAPPPDGMAPDPSSPQTSPLRSYAKDEKGQAVPVQLALQNVVEAYLRLQPTSSQEDGQEPWPRLTNVVQLAQVGLIRSVPPAPAGKKWQISSDYRVQIVDAP